MVNLYKNVKKSLENFEKSDFLWENGGSKRLFCGIILPNSVSIGRKPFACKKCDNGSEFVLIRSDGVHYDFRGFCENCKSKENNISEKTKQLTITILSKVAGLPKNSLNKFLSDAPQFTSKDKIYTYISRFDSAKEKGVNLLISNENPIVSSQILAMTANEIAEKHDKLRVIFVNLKYLSEYLAKEKDKEFPFSPMYSHADVLAIDDAGGVNLTPSQTSLLYSFFLNRMNEGRVNLISSRYLLDDLKNMIPSFYYQMAGMKPFDVSVNA